MEEGESSVQLVSAVTSQHSVREFLVQPFLVLPALTVVVRESLSQDGSRGWVQPPAQFLAIHGLMRAWRPPSDFVN